MKLQPDTFDVPSIAAVGEDWVMVQNAQTRERLSTSFLLHSAGTWEAWPVQSLAALQAQHLAPMLARQPEVVILGTGAQWALCPPTLMALLYQERIGIESMDHAAACRTYNVLAQEGRNVMLAWIKPATPLQ